MSDPVVTGTSHLIVYVRDTEASIAFWCRGLGAEIEHDHEIEAPALDAIFGRAGVRIREAFLVLGDSRLHTIETLDVPYAGPKRTPRLPGIEGISFSVDDIEKARTRAVEGGLSPTPIHDFLETPIACRMFFLDDPDGIRVEMIQYV